MLTWTAMRGGFARYHAAARIPVILIAIAQMRIVSPYTNSKRLWAGLP